MAILRQNIFDAVEARFKTILISNGFYTDLGNHVLKWREFSTVTSSEMPCVVIGDTTEEPEISNITRSSAQKRTLTIEYHILMTGPDTATIAQSVRQAQADVEKAIRVDDTWSDNALWTKPKGSQFGFSDKTSADIVGVFTGGFDVIYQTGIFNSEQ